MEEARKLEIQGITARVNAQIAAQAGKPFKQINVDAETGIHYGTLYCNDLGEFALNDLGFGDGWEDLTYQEWQQDCKHAEIGH